MFRKKRKISKFRFSYGKSPSYSRRLPQKKNSSRLLKKQHPLLVKTKRLITWLSITLLTILAIYGIFFSNYFLIENIKIDNENFKNETLNDEIRTKITNVFDQNLLFTNVEELESRILKEFPEIQEVVIKKDYPNTLKIEFEKFPLTTNVINESKSIKRSFIINSIGYAVKEDTENKSLPFIRIKSEEPVNTESPVIEAAKLNYILQSIAYFEDKFGMTIKEVEYKKTAREIHLLTEKDFYIWLDIQRPYEKQLKKLKKALVKLDIYNENLQYIDLRIAGESGDKIIYKRK